MKLKYFSNVSVYWRRPLKGNKGPTQCSKCAMYGHGASNCNRVVICSACAGNHKLSKCTLNNSGNVGTIIYKCYNCLKKNLRNVNHRADDPKCPSRQEYLDIRHRLTSKTRTTKMRPNVSFFDANEHDFPQLPRRDSLGNTRNPHTHGKLFSEVAKDKCYDNNNNDDISNEKLMEIFFDAVDALQRCQNKYDKLRVLGMMLKHAI